MARKRKARAGAQRKASTSPVERVDIDGPKSTGFLQGVVEGVSAFYATAAKVALGALEGLSDRRAEKRGARIARATAPKVGALRRKAV